MLILRRKKLAVALAAGFVVCDGLIAAGIGNRDVVSAIGFGFVFAFLIFCLLLK